MHLRKIVIMGLIALLIGSGTAYAGLTGVIAGKITDVDENPIPGVTVTVTGDNLPGARVDTTSASGTYRMPELAPGVYVLTAELMGMKTIKQTNIKVTVNATTKIKLKMEIAPYEETVVVVGKQDVLDVKAATVKATIERDVTERLPGSDDLFSAFGMTGGITGGGNVRVHGGAATDNVYLFDGVDTTDPVTSTFGANLNADAIQEVEVQTGGFQAEYGRSMGGIVNAVTKSGGNEFHGVIRVKYMTSDWQEDREHEVAGVAEYDFWEPTVTFEGPIIKDKLWFMVSYNYSNNDGTKKVISHYGADYTNPDDLVSINADREFNLPYAKLTFQPNQQHKFVVNYSGEDATLTNSSGDPQYDTPEAFNTQEQGGPFYSFEWTWLTSPNLYFIARVGSTYGVLDNVPYTKTGTDPRDASFHDTTEGQSYNNSDSWTEEDRDRFQVSFTASYFMDEMMGQHEFKSGIEYHDFKRETFSQKPGGGNYIITQERVGDPDNPDYYYGTDATRSLYLNPGTAQESGEYYAFYIQDDWAITDTITLNIGLRYEYAEFFNDNDDTDMPAWKWGDFAASEFKNADGSYKDTAPMKFDDMLAPRIGFNWDIFGTGKTAIHAFYGRFYNPFDLSLPGMFQPFSADQTATRDQQYIGPQWTDMNKDGIPDEDFFFDDANWETTGEDEPGDWNLLDPDLESEYTDEFMVGIEHEIMENFSIGLTYTHRETNDMVEDTGIFVDEDGNIVWTYRGGVKDDLSDLDPNKKFDPRDNGKDYAKHLYYVTNASGNNRKYNGLEINARARKENWDLQASYTLAKAEGSVIEGQEGFSGIAQFSGQYDTFQTSDNLFGELPWSCRHYVKVAGSYHFDVTDFYEMSFGVNAFWRSGYHYSERWKPADTYDPDDPSNDINDPSTWTGRPPYRSYSWSFPNGRGGHELPSFYTIDMSWQNTIKFGRFGAATLIFDVTNVFDHQAIISEADTMNPKKPDLFGNADYWSAPRDYRVSLKYAF